MKIRHKEEGVERVREERKISYANGSLYTEALSTQANISISTVER